MTAIIKGDEVILVVSSWTFREQVVIENLAKTVERITITEPFIIRTDRLVID
ncbi:hypothetical protein [Limosilactobacillus walteri]|uniref:hypothetical protein n=1 Tax=Limosilactobacillus walteri TaxID=2268022 RepID=UPI0015626AB7|nr:hypothetical protein [Limosilactobacillus walteri]